MPSKILKLTKSGLIKPPVWVKEATQYEVMMGSIAYGVSSDTSDIDIYGFCIEPKEYIFPHLDGKIQGFSKQIKGFDQYQEHHAKDKDSGKEYDFSIYSIVKYFRLCMDNNPNMIDSLFVPRTCVVHCTKIGEIVRENRKEFLHKGCWHKFKGYSFSQMHKARIKNPEPGSVRYEMFQKYGMDVKFCYHVVRLLNEVEQILTEGDLDLRRNREQLKSIRRGEWSFDQIEKYFEQKEKDLETLYTNSTLRYGPNEDKIKEILLNCLEEYYGSLEKCIVTEDKVILALNKIKDIVNSL